MDGVARAALATPIGWVWARASAVCGTSCKARHPAWPGAGAAHAARTKLGKDQRVVGLADTDLGLGATAGRGALIGGARGHDVAGLEERVAPPDQRRRIRVRNRQEQRRALLGGRLRHDLSVGRGLGLGGRRRHGF